MKLRNKKTGKIINSKDVLTDEFIKDLFSKDYDYFISKLNKFLEDWERCVRRTEEYWCITGRGNLHYLEDITDENDKDHKELGNYFETKEEAEKAVEKLKAWKRLKAKGFKFEGIKQDYTRFNQQEPMRTGRKYLQFNKSEDEEWMKENWEDLGLLFGGEE